MTTVILLVLAYVLVGGGYALEAWFTPGEGPWWVCIIYGLLWLPLVLFILGARLARDL